MSFVWILPLACLFLSQARCGFAQDCPQNATVLMQLKAKKSTHDGIKDSSDHHETFEEACKTCQKFSPGQSCFAGHCGDGGGQFCWSTTPTAELDDFKACPQDSTSLLSIDLAKSAGHKGATSGSPGHKESSDHHETFEEACKTCQNFSPGQSCFAGGCNDGPPQQFCWSTTEITNFKACPQDSTSLLSMNLAKSASHKGATSGEKVNVLGSALQSCSETGTALTGFTRSGKCEDEGDDDAGAHHICIKMKADFCKVTGQPNWCDDEMECMGQEGECKIDHWCVCQWAFAGYLEKAGGCDQIVDLVCEATNMAAVKAYEKSDDPSHKAALACVQSKCGMK